jgi:hypothetical protein
MRGEPTPEEAQIIAEGREAQAEMDQWGPELLATVKAVWKSVVSHQASNAGMIDPQFAVQAWYRVGADLDVERRLRSKLKPARATLSAIRARQD